MLRLYQFLVSNIRQVFNQILRAKAATAFSAS